jgi:hypothetical protein
LTKIKYRSDKFSDDISGQIMNVGNGTSESIKMIFTYYDKNGNVIGSDYSYANQDSLKPGQKSPFSQMVNEEIGDDMEAYEISLSWQNSDGSEEYIEDVQVIQDPQQKIPIIGNTKQTNENENIPFFKTDEKDGEKLEGDEEKNDDQNREGVDEDEEEEDDNEGD